MAGVHRHNDTEWVCTLNEPLMAGMSCIFCSSSVDDVDHYSIHNVQICLYRYICDRTFSRKDLLKQHVLQIHLADMDELTLKTFQVPDMWS